MDKNLMIERLGSEWGGFWIDTSLIPQGSTAICAGIGNDITFDVELMCRFGCHIVGLDPTQRAIEHIERSLVSGLITPENYTFMPRALFGKTGEVLHCHSFRSVWRQGGDESISISLPDLFAGYPDVSIVKMDIEGSEFPVIESLVEIPQSVRQIAVEFHHRLPEVPYEIVDAEKAIRALDCMGFKLERTEQDYAENLFVRRQA